MIYKCKAWHLKLSYEVAVFRDQKSESTKENVSILQSYPLYRKLFYDHNKFNTNYKWKKIPEHELLPKLMIPSMIWEFKEHLVLQWKQELFFTESHIQCH